MSTLLRAVTPPSAEDLSQAPATQSASLGRRPEHYSEPSACFSGRYAARGPRSEESLIVDSRGALTPAQMVEQKLISLLKGKAVPVSHMQVANSIRRR